MSGLQRHPISSRPQHQSASQARWSTLVLGMMVSLIMDGDGDGDGDVVKLQFGSNTGLNNVPARTIPCSRLQEIPLRQPISFFAYQNCSSRPLTSLTTGWETRRHNSAPFDWVVIRLGVASGTVTGIEVDTAFFSGNHAPHISVEGVFRPDGDEEVLSWKGNKGQWEPILGIQECGPSQRFGWKLTTPPTQRYTHVRLNMYPDGGIARFRLFGHAVPVFPADPAVVFDLAAAQNGGVAVACSDQHFGTKDNLILPGRGKDMGDGWETKRSREKGHVDWAIIRLGAPGFVERLIVDTAHFRGNFPQSVRVEAIAWEGEGEPEATVEGWVEVVGASKTGPDQEHDFVSAVKDRPFSHVKLIMIPDGGVKRLRVFARRVV